MMVAQGLRTEEIIDEIDKYIDRIRQIHYC